MHDIFRRQTVPARWQMVRGCLAESLRICRIKRNGCENRNRARISHGTFSSRHPNLHGLWFPYAFVRFATGKTPNGCRGRRRRWRRGSAAQGSSVQENNYYELVRNKRQSSNLEIACLSRSYESLESWLLGNDSTSASTSYFRYMDSTSSRSFDAESRVADVFVQRPVCTASSRSRTKIFANMIERRCTIRNRNNGT